MTACLAMLKVGAQASLIRFARGPFWLVSISKLTRSPPASESKFTLESRPVRWKKYSRPSSAAMKPKPRSETSFLMVPVGISNSSSRKQARKRAGPFENKSRPRRSSPDKGRRFYLITGLLEFHPTKSEGKESHSDKSCARSQQL